jgi:hypothetical protein
LRRPTTQARRLLGSKPPPLRSSLSAAAPVSVRAERDRSQRTKSDSSRSAEILLPGWYPALKKKSGNFSMSKQRKGTWASGSAT